MNFFAQPYVIPLLFLTVLGLVFCGIISAGVAAVLRVSKTALGDELLLAQEAKNIRRVKRIQTAQRLAADPPATIAALSIIRTAALALSFGCLALIAMLILLLWWEAVLLMVLLAIGAGIVMARVSPRQVGFTRSISVLLSLGGLLSGITTAFSWATVPTPQRKADQPIPDVEYREMVDRVWEAPGLEEDERELIKAVFEFRDILVREVMVPRTEMVTMPATASMRKILKIMLRSGFSRVPITGDSVDDLLGVVYLKDVVSAIDADPLAADRPISPLIREALFVPESKAVDNLLRELQTGATHIAIVVDEYGGIAGLITVEDIIEELVGELVDEHDSVTIIEPEEISPDVWRVSTRLSVDDLGDLFDLRIDDDDVDTVGGLLAKSLGKVPLTGSEGDIAGLHLVAERVQGRRKQIATVIVSRA